MQKKDQLLLINRICDEFEAKLQLDSSTDIKRTLESTSTELVDQGLVKNLLVELISLKIAYSENRDATAKSLKERYPEYVVPIENAISQPSLYGTVQGVNGDTSAESNTLPVAPAESFAQMGERFENLVYLASGGLGDVYAGYDKSVKRQVAIKLLKSHLVANADSKRRFLNEAAITGGLEHPGIVPIYDSGISDDGRPYYVMRLFRGRTMKEEIAKLHSNRDANDFSDKQRQLVRRLADVSKAISYSHDNDVIHRDLKPANILLGDYGESIVIDWGLARSGFDSQESTREIDEQCEPVIDLPTDGNSNSMTRAGTILGTPGYMSPEQASGDPAMVSKPTDIYSLGAMLYTILTGDAPVHDCQLENLKSKPSANRLPSSGKSSALTAICIRSMNHNPDQRYPDARSFGFDLESWLNDLPVAAKPDSIVDTAARFFRKNRTWSLIAAATLLTITLSSLLVASAFKTKSVKMGQLQQQTFADAEIQKDLADANLELAEREKTTGQRLRNRLNALESYIRLSTQDSGNFSKESLKELILGRMETFKNSNEILPATMLEHVDTAVSALSLITAHEAALSTYQEFSELRGSLITGLPEQVYAVADEAELMLATGEPEKGRLTLDLLKAEAIKKLGLDHDATQNLLRLYLKCLRDRFSSERAAAACSAFGSVKIGNEELSLKTTCLLYTSPSPRDLSTSRMPSSA